MELAEMENETEAIDDVFVLCVLPPSLSLSFWLSPSFPSLSVIFRHYCLSFSVCPIQSAPLSLATPSTHSHPHTLTYKHSYHWPTGTHYFCDPRLLYGGLVLKMGIYCSP